MWTPPPIESLRDAIELPSNPIGMRMRAAYFLRQAYENTGNMDNEAKESENSPTKSDIIKILGDGLSDKNHGSLMRHEFAYVMGQLRDVNCAPVLEQILCDSSDCVMVRHECAEALGAIGSISSIPTLKNVMEESKEQNYEEIYQTCKIALDFLNWKNKGGYNSDKKQNALESNDEKKNEEDNPPMMVCACMLNPYSSTDPAPPHPKHANLSTGDIGKILKDQSEDLFERYRAMFSLRNRGGEEAAKELSEALVTDKSSALFRHEVAYVLGQMQQPISVEYLGICLRKGMRRKDGSGEHEMVRHEAAEALGSLMEYRWEESESILKEFLEDEDIVVKESCMVALDAADYWNVINTDTSDAKDDHSIDCHDGIDEHGNEIISFGKQKAASDGMRKSVLNNHFNVID